MWQAVETPKERALHCAWHAEEVRQWCLPLQASEMPSEGALFIHRRWRRGAEVPVMASRWHAQRGSFRTQSTVLIVWGNGTSLSKQIGHLKRELLVEHSRCSCTFIMSGTSLPFLWCTCSLLVSWAWQINSVQWLWSPNPGEYSQVGHLMDLHPSQLCHSVCANKTHSNLHSAIVVT
jgi:hypothetical protein